MDQCQIHNVIEFGTGNGDWLNYLRTKWNTPQRFLGIDLATQQIEENRTRYPAFEFMSGDLTEWVKQNRTEHTVFVTHCGVLEYLSEASLQRLLNDLISLHRKSVLFWIEPIAADFDLQSERYSQTLGNEFSFSHPYPTLIRRSGFELQTLTEKSVEGFRMLCLTAIHPDFNFPGDRTFNPQPPPESIPSHMKGARNTTRTGSRTISWMETRGKHPSTSQTARIKAAQVKHIAQQLKLGSIGNKRV